MGQVASSDLGRGIGTQACVQETEGAGGEGGTWSWLKAWSGGCEVTCRAQLSLRLHEESKRDSGCGRRWLEVFLLLVGFSHANHGSPGMGWESSSPHSGVCARCFI